uniref:Helicase ATP-binding domain-containing protein n=1 Tax=viral metagenome TaxID=1070528 RepID=A0A6C0BER0_9ZZZZ
MEEHIPFYPDLNENDSQFVLNALAEFSELKAKSEMEPRVSAGSYYRAQEVVSRLLRILDRLFIIHEPGTGKSCTITATIELIKEITNLFDKIFIVTYSSLTDAMQRQIICKCTNNKYINDKGRSGAKKAEVRSSGKTSFTQSYTLESFGEFSKRIKDKTVDQLKSDFKFSVICVDEATFLINSDYTTNIPLKKPNGSITWNEKILDNDILMLKNITNEIIFRNDINFLNHPSIISSDKLYIQYWRLFHATSDISKVILATGAPNVNRSSEQNMLANLLLPLDRQIDIQLFAENIFNYNIKHYEKYYNNLFSFVKSSNIVAKAIYKGTKLKKKYIVEFPANDFSENPGTITKEFDSQFIVYKVELFGYQADKLFQIKNENSANQISSTIDETICYTDFTGSCGVEANSNKQKLSYLSQPTIDGLNIRMNSCAIYMEIYRIELKALNDSKLKGKPGPGLCFNYIHLTNAAISSLKEIFSFGGFEILEDFSIFKETGGDYCNVSNVTFRGLLKRPRAVFLSGSVDPKIRNFILELAGSPDNVYGEYIQFLDGSKVMGIGINTKNAMRFIRPINEWNEAVDKQSRDRVFREDSHDAIRNELADEEYIRTGTRPNPYDVDVNVDVYNMCAFTRYFYIDMNSVKNLPKVYGAPETTPFRLEKNNKQITIRTILGADNQQLLINHDSVMHIVGFAETGKAKSIMYKQIMEYCVIGQIPHVEISKREGFNINTDLSNINLIHMDIILCMSGILYCFNLTPETLKFFTKKVFVYHIDCDFMKDYTTGVYINECYAVIIKNNEKENLLGVPEGAKIDKDYSLIPINMEYFSPTENGYILLETKSFGTRRTLRIAKRFAVDCITNYMRTYNNDGVDGTLDCDYEECQYTCSSKVLTDVNNKSKDSYLYEDRAGNYDPDKVYWSNYEILYSKKIIEQCKEKIVKMFSNKSEIKLNEIYSKLLDEYKREYFISMAIYSLVNSRYKIMDSFGFDSYITRSEDSLFLIRNFPELIKNGNRRTGRYSDKFIAITSEPDYRNILNVDDHIIDEIEKINFKSDISTKEINHIISYIVSKINEFKIYTPLTIIERSFGRIAYDRLTNPEFRNPEFREKPVDQIVCGDIFPIRCFTHKNNDGSITFFHNQPETVTSGRHGEIAKIKNASERFKIFYIQDGKPMWRNATESEQKQLKPTAINSINEKIKQTSTLTINGENFVSQYYVSFYNGTFRFSNITKGHGEDFSSLNPKEIRTFLNWASNSPLMKIRGNYERLAYIYSLLSNSGEKDEKINKTERNKAIINFFRSNKLIVKYSVMPEDESSLYNVDDDPQQIEQQYPQQYPQQIEQQYPQQIEQQYQQQIQQQYPQQQYPQQLEAPSSYFTTNK